VGYTVTAIFKGSAGRNDFAWRAGSIPRAVGCWPLV